MLLQFHCMNNYYSIAFFVLYYNKFKSISQMIKTCHKVFWRRQLVGEIVKDFVSSYIEQTLVYAFIGYPMFASAVKY